MKKIIRNKRKCDKCYQEISLSNYKKHYNKCNGIAKNDKKMKMSWLQDNGNYKCPLCEKEFKGINFHIWAKHNENNKNWHPNKGKPTWNKGKKTGPRSLEDKEKIAKNNKGGRGKQGKYKNIYCNSSWELAYLIYCFDNNIKIQRNTQGFEYIFNGMKFHYFPDFIKENDTYVEIKGYKNERYNDKISQFKNKLEIIDKEKIKPYLDYVIQKYGINFIELYEK
jgi:hypothetical protein